MREIKLHLCDVFFAGDGFRQVFVHLVHELGAELDHLVHRAVLGKRSVLVAIDAIIFILASVGISAEDFIAERHAAALTEFHFHGHLVFPLPPREIFIYKYSDK